MCYYKVVFIGEQFGDMCQVDTPHPGAAYTFVLEPWLSDRPTTYQAHFIHLPSCNIAI